MRLYKPIDARFEPLYAELWEAAGTIKTAADLYRYAGVFPSPRAGAAIRRCLEYFAKKKTKGDGSRDGYHVWFNSVKLGFGKRLTSEQQITEWLTTRSGRQKNLMIGMWMWFEDPVSVDENETYRDRILHKKEFGIEDPRNLASLFVLYIGFYERGLPRPELPGNW